MAGATQVPVPGATTTAVPSAATGYSATFSSGGGCTPIGSNLYITPISTSPPTYPGNPGPYTPPTGGTTYAYVSLQNTGTSTIACAGPNTLVVTVPSVTPASAYYLALNPGNGTGYFGNIGPGSISGNNITFTTGQSISLTPGQIATYALYSVPVNTGAPNPQPVNGGAASNNTPTTLSGPPAATTGGVTATSTTPVTAPAGTVITTNGSNNSPSSVGLPQFSGPYANGALGSVVYYGSFSSNNTFTANGGQQANADTLTLQVPAGAASSVYYLIPYNGSTYVTGNPIQSSSVTGTGPYTVTFTSSAFQQFTAGTTYGFVVYR